MVDKLLGNGLASGAVCPRYGARRALFAPLLVHLVPIEAAALAAPAARVLLVPHHDEVRVARLGTRRVGEPAQRLAPKPQPLPIQPQLRSPTLVHCTHHLSFFLSFFRFTLSPLFILYLYFSITARRPNDEPAYNLQLV